MNRSVLLLLLALLVVLFIAPPAAFADKIIFKNGRSFEGKLIRETSTHYVFKVRGMGEQKFKKSEVLKIEKGESSFDIYAARKKTVKADDVKGLYDLGSWCKEQGLMKEAKQCFRAAIKADPDHAPSRRALGYVRWRGDWMTEKKYKKVAAEIEAKEAEIIAGIKPAKEPVQDATLRYMIIGPEGWSAKKEEGEGVTFDGPELGSGPVTVTLAVDTEGGELDKLVKATLKELTEEHDGLMQQGEITDVTLANQPAKLLMTTWTADDIQPWAVDMERRDILMVASTGAYHLSIECVAGYYEKLKTTFEKVIGSVKMLAKPLDVMAQEHGFGFSFPDDTYEKGIFSINLDAGGRQVQIRTTGTVVGAGVKGKVVYFMVRVGKKAESTTLDTLKADVVNYFNAKGLLTLGTTSESRKVDGVDALWGNINVAQGNMGRGYWCVFTKGERTYQCMFIALMGQMGNQYMKKDFESCLESFKFL